MTENPRLDLLVRQTSGFPVIAVDASLGGAVNSASHSFPSFNVSQGKGKLFHGFEGARDSRRAVSGGLFSSQF